MTKPILEHSVRTHPLESYAVFRRKLTIDLLLKIGSPAQIHCYIDKKDFYFSMEEFKELFEKLKSINELCNIFLEYDKTK